MEAEVGYACGSFLQMLLLKVSTCKAISKISDSDTWFTKTNLKLVEPKALPEVGARWQRALHTGQLFFSGPVRCPIMHRSVLRRTAFKRNYTGFSTRPGISRKRRTKTSKNTASLTRPTVSRRRRTETCKIKENNKRAKIREKKAPWNTWPTLLHNFRWSVTWLCVSSEPAHQRLP